MHSSVDEHFSCFHLLAIMNNAAINICVKVLMWINVFISLVYIPMSEITGSNDISMFNFFEDLLGCFPKWSHNFTFPPSVYKDSIFFTSSLPLVIFPLNQSHPSGWEVVSHCGCEFWFLMTNIISINF